MSTELEKRFTHRTPAILRWIGGAFLWLMGWKAAGHVPSHIKKAVVICAPHTTNWDFPFAMAICWVKDVPFRFLAKDTIFKGLSGKVLRAMGGIPVNRRASTGLVDQVAEMFEQHEELLLLIAAEGSRSYRDYWKSGFYWMAVKAKVPILTGYVDFPRKKGGFGPLLEMSGDPVADMDQLREIYTGKVGRHPEKMGPIRLRAEVEEGN